METRRDEDYTSETDGRMLCCCCILVQTSEADGRRGFCHNDHFQDSIRSYRPNFPVGELHRQPFLGPELTIFGQVGETVEVILIDLTETNEVHQSHLRKHSLIVLFTLNGP